MARSATGPHRDFTMNTRLANTATLSSSAFAKWLVALPLIVLLSAPVAADVLPPLPNDAFTVVIIPDTQHYLGPGTKIGQRGSTMFPGMIEHPYVIAHAKISKPQTTDTVNNIYLRNHIEWIKGNQQSQNIVFVSHVGDIVEINRREEWEVAKQHIDQLRGIVPFGLTVGNHDMERNGDARLFQQTFPASSFDQYDWYLGCYSHDRGDQHVSANNVNSVQLFSAAGIDFIFLHLECNAPDDVLEWASDILNQHPERRALISTHMDLGITDKPKTAEGYIHDPKGRMRWLKIHPKEGNTAEQIWGKLYRRHANISFVFSGDQSRVTAMRVSEKGDGGNIVHSLLSDYMSRGALRLVRFIPSKDQVQVITYDTTLDQLVESMPYVPNRDQHQFTIDYDMSNRESRKDGQPPRVRDNAETTQNAFD